MRRLILAAALVVALQPVAFARSAMETNQLVDDNGVPIGTATNPLFVSGGAGGGGGGTVTQGPAATDAVANRWPVLAYQGGSWSVAVSNSFALDATLTARFGTLGQKVMTGSAPVVIASDQSAIPVTGTFFQATQPVSAASLPLPAGAATAANQNSTAAGTSASNAQAVQGVTGGVPQNVAGTVTANVGTTNGLALDATLTARLGTLGQKASTGSAPVVIASDQSTVPVGGTVTANLGTIAGVATATNQASEIAALGAPADAAYAGSGNASIIAGLKGVYSATLLPLAAGSNVIGSTTLRAGGTNRSASVSTTAANLMAANTARQGWKVKNDCSVAVWINFDTTATAAAGSGNIQIPAGSYMASEPGFIETGAMSAIATSGTCALTAREH